MTKKFLQLLALSALIAVPATFVFGQDAAGTPAATANAGKKAKKKKQVAWLVKLYFKGQKDAWDVNYPDKLLPPNGEKPLKVDLWAHWQDRPSGTFVLRETVDLQTGIKLPEEHPLKDVVKIEWWRNEKQLQAARNELMQGNSAAALEIAERFLLFFKDIKNVEGSLWLEAALIKLDALDRQANDASLNAFIRELEMAGATSKVEGLSDRIKLIRLKQNLRKNEFALVLRDSEVLLKTSSDPELLAQLTMLKGRADYGLGKYEDALFTFLRVPVFYGNQEEFVPAAKLEAARCFYKLDNPDNKAQNLAGIAESYIMEVINEYPMTPEAKDALALLPKDKQDALAKRDSLEEARKRALVSSTISSGDGSSSSDDGEVSAESSDDEIFSDDDLDFDEDDSE